VLVLSQHLEDRSALDLVGDRAEGVGYLLKDRVGGLATFVEAAATGCRRRVAARSPGRYSAWWAAAEGEPARQADPREREVLALIAEGHSNHGIAEELVAPSPQLNGM
jgi:DNA-binding NarL/FixJ family response regulator